jgi:hypothetical protein
MLRYNGQVTVTHETIFNIVPAAVVHKFVYALLSFVRRRVATLSKTRGNFLRVSDDPYNLGELRPVNAQK